MTLNVRTFALMSALVPVALGGCSSQVPAISTLSGSIEQASFPTAVKRITITSTQGKSTSAVVGAHGEFSISLEKGASYRILLSDDGKSMPIVLNSEQSRLMTTVLVKSGGANVDLGHVRYWAGDAANAASSKNVAPSTTTNTATKCVNGLVEGSTKPCAAGAAPTTCSDDGDGDGDGDGEQADDGDSQQSDGEQADGPDPEEEADAAQAMGIPEHNAPTALGCAGGDQGDGDGEQQDD